LTVFKNKEFFCICPKKQFSLNYASEDRRGKKGNEKELP